VSEHSPASHKNLSIAAITASFAFGGLLSNIVATFINSYFTNSEILAGAWRYPFILGSFFIVISFLLRRILEETPVFLSIKNEILVNQVNEEDFSINSKKECDAYVKSKDLYIEISTINKDWYLERIYKKRQLVNNFVFVSSLNQLKLFC
jgi:MFS family permease